MTSCRLAILLACDVIELLDDKFEIGGIDSRNHPVCAVDCLEHEPRVGLTATKRIEHTVDDLEGLVHESEEVRAGRKGLVRERLLEFFGSTRFGAAFGYEAEPVRRSCSASDRTNEVDEIERE